MKRLTTLALFLCISLHLVAQQRQLLTSPVIDIHLNAQMLSSIAESYFPQTVETDQITLSITRPRIHLDNNRLGLSVDFSANDDNSIYQKGAALVTAAISYDRLNKKFILVSPKLDALVFFEKNTHTNKVRQKIERLWASNTKNDLHLEIPKDLPYSPLFDQLEQIKVANRKIYLQIRNPLFPLNQSP